MKEIIIYSNHNKDVGSISIKSLPSVYQISDKNLKSIKVGDDKEFRTVTRVVITSVGGARIWCKGSGPFPLYNGLTKIVLNVESDESDESE